MPAPCCSPVSFCMLSRMSWWYASSMTSQFWSNKALLVSYAVAVGLQLLVLYTPLGKLFGVVPLDWRAWLVMVSVTAGSSFFGVYMTRWILKLVPLWEEKIITSE